MTKKIFENYFNKNLRKNKKNTNEGIMDFFKSEKVETAEDFFEIDQSGSQGAKGLILKMLDVMTPDVNIEQKGMGKEQADAVGYVQDYVKSSFLGKIDSNPERGENENADFAKFMDSEAWGENINFDTLIKATKELYEHAGNFFDEGLSGSDTETRQQAVLTLGVNTIPVLLLFYCLKTLGSSLIKMRKRYNNKRGQVMNESQNNKIFNSYFKQNLKEEAEVSTSDPDAADIADIVVDEINAIFNELPDNSPLKSREVALAALAKIKAGLPAMIQGLNVS